jgi:hypothetical protein
LVWEYTIWQPCCIAGKCLLYIYSYSQKDLCTWTIYSTTNLELLFWPIKISGRGTRTRDLQIRELRAFQDWNVFRIRRKTHLKN